MQIRISNEIDTAEVDKGYAVQINQTAYLSNRGEYTTFSVGDRTITFLTSKNLENLLIDPVSFLDPIEDSENGFYEG